MVIGGQERRGAELGVLDFRTRESGVVRDEAATEDLPVGVPASAEG
jgi:hypothetical protein